MIIGQDVELLGGGIHQSFLAKAKRRTPKTCHAFDQFVTRIIGDINAVPAGNDVRTGLFVGGMIGIGMQVARDIAAGI